MVPIKVDVYDYMRKEGCIISNAIHIWYRGVHGVSENVINEKICFNSTPKERLPREFENISIKESRIIVI